METPSKRKPGRPRKIMDNKQSKIGIPGVKTGAMSGKRLDQFTAASGGSLSGDAPTGKRGRGRPRMNFKNVVIDGDMDHVVTRKPGRRRKR